MKKALRYSLAVCLISWVAFLIFHACTGFDVKSSQAGFSLFSAAYMFFPLITAVILQKVDREPQKSTGLLGFRPGWTWLAAVILPLVICLLSTLISGLLPGVHFHYGAEQILSMQGQLDEETAARVEEQLASMPPALMLISTFISSILAGCTINAAFAFGEEYGWRNYLASALRGCPFWKASLLIGAVWGIWHFPLILCGHNYPQHPVAGVPMMIVFCCLIGIIELYLVKKSGSVYPAAIFHGTVNASCGAALILVQGGNDLTIGATGLAGFVALALVIAALWAYDRNISKENIFSSVL